MSQEPQEPKYTHLCFLELAGCHSPLRHSASSSSSGTELSCFKDKYSNYRQSRELSEAGVNIQLTAPAFPVPLLRFPGSKCNPLCFPFCPQVLRSCCSLSSHHCRLLVKRETSEWHLCNRRAGMETWHVCGAPWVHGTAWVVTPKPTTRWAKGWVAKLMAEGSSQGLTFHPHSADGDIPTSPTSPLPQVSWNTMDISLVPTGQ